MDIEQEIVNKFKARLLALKARANLMPLQDWMKEGVDLLLHVREEALKELRKKDEDGEPWN